MRTVSLTSGLLKRIIEEERSKLDAEHDVAKAAEETEEVEADELAHTLAKPLDFVKALKIEEARLTKRLATIREARLKLTRKMGL